MWKKKQDSINIFPKRGIIALRQTGLPDNIIEDEAIS
jgi:hypothetical protein